MSKIKKQKEEKRELIMDVALEFFSEKGFHSVSISEIAKNAGVSKGNIYNYFESKQDLLVEIVMNVVDDIYSDFDTNHDGSLSNEEFFNFIDKLFDNIKARRIFWKLMFSLLLQPQVIELLEDKKSFQDTGERVINLLYKYFNSIGSSDPEGDLLIFSSLLKGSIMQYVYSPESLDIQKFKKRIISDYKKECHINKK